MRPGLIVLWFALVSLAGCAMGEGGGSAGDSFTLPPSAGDPKSIAPPTGRLVRGVLTFDDIEGGCAYLEAADGTRFEVMYPPGWALDRAAAVLRGPDGSIVRAGAIVTVSGSIATDRSSICQVGPIFRADTVEVAPG